MISIKVRPPGESIVEATTSLRFREEGAVVGQNAALGEPPAHKNLFQVPPTSPDVLSSL